MSDFSFPLCTIVKHSSTGELWLYKGYGTINKDPDFAAHPKDKTFDEIFTLLNENERILIRSGYEIRTNRVPPIYLRQSKFSIVRPIRRNLKDGKDLFEELMAAIKEKNLGGPFWKDWLSNFSLFCFKSAVHLFILYLLYLGVRFGFTFLDILIQHGFTSALEYLRSS
ncbi:MAG TPA: hypothetical protein VK492_08270 [Chitinophagaceae bacterium]|nr:hypothetical protein [Chitinophagaceae bacterium]